MLVDGWIDVHAHFTLPRPAEINEAIVQVMRQACWCIDEAPAWSVEHTLDYMDRAGIQMQLLSNLPKTYPELRQSNDFGASLVREHPSRFGLLAALPTDDPGAALAEIERAAGELEADGFAVTCRYNGVYLSDPRLAPVLAELNRRKATVFAHPDAYLPGAEGRPAALIEVAFETARTFTDMLYAGTFREYPDITFVVAHGGGALPALAGRLLLLGLESWVPNPRALSEAEMESHLRALHLDTAATSPTALAAALAMTTPERLVFGSDCGVPCTNEESMARSIQALQTHAGLSKVEVQRIGRNALRLFPQAARRLDRIGVGAA
jgi:predicted TIM-barrel fold metal-dependent hydrolase